MVLRRHAAVLVCLAIGAGACSFLVRGSIDEYPDEDADGDADVDADADADVDADADADGGVDGGGDCSEGDAITRCTAFCDQQVGCPDSPFTDENCLQACRCYFGLIYQPKFARPFIECTLDSGCMTVESSSACAYEAYECVAPGANEDFRLDCWERSTQLDCPTSGRASLDCDLAPAIQEEPLPGWEACLGEANCMAVNVCRDGAFVRYCEL